MEDDGVMGTDAFDEFLGVLAGVLEDAVVDGEEVARRVGLSRFHLDRVVAAAAGEPPARMRRRVLLERAAYRLLTTTWSILDVAVEAGYGTHESFTRAFSRAYGVAPAMWRRQPTRLQVGSPGGVHFHPPAGIRVPAREKVSSMDVLTRMVEHHVWLAGELMTRAATLPDDRLDAPIELSVEGVDDDPTVRRLLARLVIQLEMWTAAIAGRPYEFPSADQPSISELTNRLAVAGPEFLDQVRTVCAEGRLDELIVCPGEPVEIYTFGAVIAHVLTFAAHRRTLLTGALTDGGFTDLDSGDPIRWLSAR
ncbi:helix-turn-helix domain-containing protein [Kribbella sp. NPDC050124]|uniref:helix-turn-helix domain-containing protein n=1 Tax=Kribbella sp. NPDC050124 TaxID=3364114 RepID=UPI0037B04A42